MNYLILKKVYEDIPYILKAPFAGILRSKVIKNKLFIQQYEELQKQSTYSAQELDTIQFSLLKETLIHAYEHTVYYNRLFNEAEFNPYEINSVEELNVIPTLSKKELQEHFDDLVSDDIEGGYIVTTGGTSGKPTKVLMSNQAFYIEWAFVYNFWSKFGYNYKKSRVATFRGVKLGDKICKINPMYAEIRMNPFLLNLDNVELYWKKISNYGAEFIYGYPSAIYTFCKMAKEKGILLKNKFKAVLLISENLYPFQEELIKGVLDCPIAMFYGHSERAVFGEKVGNGYIFNPFYGVTEVNEKGQPIVTGFINRKMPLIRYIVDDYVEQDGEVYLIKGHHESELLYGKNMEEISASAINFHDKTFENIDAYQFVQDVPGRCKLLLKSERLLSEEQKDKIHKSVEQKMGKVLECRVEQTEDLILSNRGKYRMIIQNIDRNSL